MAEAPKMITELTDILDQDIETIVALRMNAERKVSRHQRLIEKAIGNLGRPTFFYFIILFVIGWIVVSTSATRLHVP